VFCYVELVAKVTPFIHTLYIHYVTSIYMCVCKINSSFGIKLGMRKSNGTCLRFGFMSTLISWEHHSEFRMSSHNKLDINDVII
jgi:hypothetical protein